MHWICIWSWCTQNLRQTGCESGRLSWPRLPSVLREGGLANLRSNLKNLQRTSAPRGGSYLAHIRHERTLPVILYCRFVIFIGSDLVPVPHKLMLILEELFHSVRTKRLEVRRVISPSTGSTCMSPVYPSVNIRLQLSHHIKNRTSSMFFFFFLCTLFLVTINITTTNNNNTNKNKQQMKPSQERKEHNPRIGEPYPATGLGACEQAHTHAHPIDCTTTPHHIEHQRKSVDPIRTAIPSRQGTN